MLVRAGDDGQCRSAAEPVAGASALTREVLTTVIKYSQRYLAGNLYGPVAILVSAALLGLAPQRGAEEIGEDTAPALGRAEVPGAASGLRVAPAR